MIKILVTGSECSGKTTLAHGLAQHYRAVLIPELARSYLTLVDGVYHRHDLKLMAQAQHHLQNALAGVDKSMQIHDTSWLVYKIWSSVRYGRVDREILEGFAAFEFDLIFLCEPTPIYEIDPLRPNGSSRWSLFYLYLKDLVEDFHLFKVLRGTPSERLAYAVTAIDEFLV